MGTFLPVLVFLFELIISSKKIKYLEKRILPVLFFIWTDFQFKQKKSTRKKSTQKYEFLFFLETILFLAQCLARKKYEFLFFLELILFLKPIFFGHNARPENSMSSFFLKLILFFGTHTFFGTMFGPKKVWVPFFLELILFLRTHTFFGTMLGPEKVWVPFFWNPYFFWHNVRPEKCMSSFFFWNSYFFWNPYLFCHYVGPGKSMSSFFWTHTIVLAPILFFGTIVGPKNYEFFFQNPLFSGAMLGP